MSRPRFILVDPSFTDKGGDKWQYAVTFAKAAAESGYDFVLLTHKRAPDISPHVPHAVQQRRVFDHAFFEHDKIVSRDANAWCARMARGAQQRLSGLARRHDAEERRLKNQTGSLRGLLARAGRALSLMTLRAQTQLFDYADRHRRLIAPFNRDDFGLALAAELASLKPRPGDRLFLHTATPAMLESLSEARLAGGLGKIHDIDAHFLFHFGKDAPDARTFLDRYYSYSAPRTLTKRLAVSSPFRRLHFHATSETLAEELRDLFQSRVSVFDGLTDLSAYLRALEPLGGLQSSRDKVWQGLAEGRVRLVARVADLTTDKARQVARAAHLVQHRGFSVELTLIYHAGTIGKLRDILAAVDFPFVRLTDTTDNDAYLRELAQATLVLLPYDARQYEKRVSAVLHDCAVLGVPAVVPKGTTLADMESVRTYVYFTPDQMLGTVLNAVRSLSRETAPIAALAEGARKIYASNVIDRLVKAAATPSLTIETVAPVANVVRPMWGRCGSSFAFDSQIDLLLSRGYFVVEHLLASDPLSRRRDVGYLWRMLNENSQRTRGCIQRIAFRPDTRPEPYFANVDALTALAKRIGQAETDPAVEPIARSAALTIVNHSFNALWADRRTSGRRVIDTHDVQSYVLFGKGTPNEASGEPERLEALLKGERKLLRTARCLVNVGRDDHLILGQFNGRGVIVTPHVPAQPRASRYASVADMAIEHDWHEAYRSMREFDLFIAGDAHPANVTSVSWFLEKVFIPYLQPHGVSLVLCGRVSHAIHEIYQAVPYVFYLGFVDDLPSVRALSKVAILPDRSGTGVSIKSLEAFASSMPFVATSHALRGLRELVPGSVRTHDDPEGMAGAIQTLLSSEKERRAASQLAASCYAATAAYERWYEGWSSALDQALQ